PGAIASAADALAGPEGYDLSWGTSNYQASAHQTSEQTSAAIGVRAEACVGTPGITKAFGVEAKACAHASLDHSWTASDSDSSGGQSSGSASFNGGLRLRDTPFPARPAGALLVVFAQPQSGAVVDAHVVATGASGLVVPA